MARRDTVRARRDLMRQLTEQIRAIEQGSAFREPGLGTGAEQQRMGAEWGEMGEMVAESGGCEAMEDTDRLAGPGGANGPDGPSSPDGLDGPGGPAGAVAVRPARGGGLRAVATGWGEVDGALAGGDMDRAGLDRGVIHEWFGVAEPGEQGGSGNQHRRCRGKHWTPPLCLLVHLAWQALAQEQAAGDGAVLWIGKSCWPHARVLIRDHDTDGRRLLRQSIFADPPDAAARRWAIDLALRSPAVTAVVADGSGLDMAATRRLQLAAESGRALALLARPPHELSKLSAAATRWVVAGEATRRRSDEATEGTEGTSCDGRGRVSVAAGVLRGGREQSLELPGALGNPRWTIELRRCKAQRAFSHTTRRWVLEWHRGNFAVPVSAELVDRSDHAPPGLEEDAARKTA